MGIVKEAPKFATAAVQAAGSLGGSALKFAASGAIPIPISSDDAQPEVSSDQEVNPADSGQTADIGIDPAIAGADQIQEQLLQLYTLVHGDLLGMLQETEANQDLLECAEQLKSSRDMLGDFKSQHTTNAKRILTQGLQTAESVLGSRKVATSMSAGDAQWQQKVEKWKKDVETAHAASLQLKAFASAQAGQGFGNSLDIPVKSSSDSLGIDFTSILKARHQKLLIMRTAMREAQQNLQKTNDKYQATQNRVIELAEQMQHLKLSKITIKEIREVLNKAIDTVTFLQREIRSLTLFFNFMSNTISVFGTAHTERYLNAVESGISEEGVDFGISLGNVQTHMIREALLLLRGHFTFVVESARLYQKISAAYILPCIRMTAELQVGASVEEQNVAKQQLKEFTDKAAADIKLLAEKELEAFNNQIKMRCEEIDEQIEEEMKDLPVLEPYVQKAIDEGVKESSQQMLKDSSGLAEELDDILG